MHNDHGAAPPGLPPLYDLDAERAVLGSILAERDAIIAAAPLLTAGDFAIERHAAVYAAALACYQRREPPDLVTVLAELRATDRLRAAGGIAEVAALSDAAPSAVHVEHYARIVAGYATRRRLDEAAGQVRAAAHDPDPAATVEGRLERAAAALAAVAAGHSPGEGFVSAAAATSEYLSAVQAAPDEGDDGMLGLPTGYGDLDRITRGMKPGELIILAARPGKGKTSLALCIAEGVARRGVGVGVFSLEMDRELLINRLVAARIGVDSTRVPGLVRRGDVRAMDALGDISSLPLWVDHTPALTATAIRARAQRLAAEQPIGLWVVDYLQLATSGSPRDDEYQRVSAVSRGLTEFARKTRIPVLALSQLSRAVEGRTDGLPRLSDLRGSGSIEQDASQVWFIHWEPGEDGEAGVTEIHVAKHRNGDTGVAPLHFDRATASFRNLERYREPIGFEERRYRNAAG